MSKTNPFAGLMAGFRGARAEDETPDDESAARAARRAEEDEQREKEDARRAEEDARRAEEDGPGESDETDGKKGKKGKKAEDDDQDPEADASDDEDSAEEGMDDKEAKAFRRGLAIGRARENARGSRIFLAAAETGRPDLAATLAFTTRNTSAEAGRLMGVAGAAPRARGRLDERMNNRPEPRPGAGGGQAAKPTFGERAAAAVAKIRG
jgi:hypothetical protein